MTAKLTTEQMLPNQNVTFPALWERRMDEFGKAHAQMPSIWTDTDCGMRMQYGQTIFLTMDSNHGSLCNKRPVHEGFKIRLESSDRAWDDHDDSTNWLPPISTTTGPVAASGRAQAAPQDLPVDCRLIDALDAYLQHAGAKA